MDKKLLPWIKASIVVEIFGTAIFGGGLGFEIATGQDLGLILMSIGALMVTGGGAILIKIRHAFR